MRDKVYMFGGVILGISFVILAVFVILAIVEFNADSSCAGQQVTLDDVCLTVDGTRAAAE